MAAGQPYREKWTAREVSMMIEMKRLRALNKALWAHIADLTNKLEEE